MRMQARTLHATDREVTIEGALLARETAAHRGLIDARGELDQRVAAQPHPQHIWTAQVGKASDAGNLDLERNDIGGDHFQLRLETIDLFRRHRRAKELERQMKIGGRDPSDAVIMRSELRDEIIDRALDFGIDADGDERADFFGRIKHTQNQN